MLVVSLGSKHIGSLKITWALRVFAEKPIIIEGFTEETGKLWVTLNANDASFFLKNWSEIEAIFGNF